MGKTKLYALLIVACAAGYAWLFFSLARELSEKKAVGVCLLKQATGVPCPSCGSTRAALSLLHGNFMQSLLINPFGVIIVAIMLIAPIWIFVDIASRKSTLLEFYARTETILKKPGIAIPLVLLVAINWIWNITKGL